MTVAGFRKIVWKHYEKHGRHNLPWRKTHNPYHILVSEIMLQQTQVDRVLPFYKAWLHKFPTVQSLAAAPLCDVLRQWQGLGYNRRAKMLHTATQVVVRDFAGKLPRTATELESLPGVGHYTARAVMAFAHNEDVVFVETNLRTVVMHRFFTLREPASTVKLGTEEKISDAEILAILEKALVKGRARAWYSALMDYGTYLKASGIRTNHRAKSYTKQSTFEGSDRQVRGSILRALVGGPKSKIKLEVLFDSERTEQINLQLEKLEKEGMVVKRKTSYSLPK